MVDIFDEVEDDLRAERTRSLLVRYGGLLAGLALVAVLGVAGWQGWRWHERRGSMTVAGLYMGAAEHAGATGAAVPAAGAEQLAALPDFARVAAEGNGGYPLLARLREAAIRADSGDLPAALALWDQVANDTAADAPIRDVATLLWVERQVDSGDPAALQARLRPLLAPDNVWHPLALEDQALIQLRTGATGPARDTLRQVANDPTAPQGVRGRAGNLLARLGG